MKAVLKYDASQKTFTQFASLEKARAGQPCVKYNDDVTIVLGQSPEGEAQMLWRNGTVTMFGTANFTKVE